MTPAPASSDPLVHALAEALAPAVREAVDEAVSRALCDRADNGQLLTVAGVAERLACSQPHVRRLIAAGRLPAVNVGHTVRVRAEDVARLVAEGCDLPVPEGTRRQRDVGSS